MNREADGKATIKSGLYHMIANVISMAVSLVTLSLLSRMMSTSDMGISTSFITLQTILSYICLFAIYTSINKVLLNKKIDHDVFFSTISLFSVFSTTIFYIIYLLFQTQIKNIFGFNLELMSFMFLSILFDNILIFVYTKWVYYNNYIKSFIYNIISSPVSQIISLIFVYYLSQDKYYGRIIGLKILPLIIGFIYFIIILYKGKFKFNTNYLKYSLTISAPIVAHLLSQIVLSNSDLLMIKSMIGNSEAGIYSVAYTIGNVLLTTILCVLKPWSPWVYRRMDDNEKQAIYNNSKIICIINFILCLGLMTIAPEMVRLFISKAFQDSIYIIIPICIGMYFQGIYLLFYDVEYFHKKTKSIAIYSVIAAIVNIILNYIFIRSYGYIAAAYTTMASYLILSLLHYYGMKKADNEKVIDVKSIVIFSILLIVLSIIINELFSLVIIRYLLFIIIGIVLLIIEKDDFIIIIEMFTGIKNIKRYILKKIYAIYRFIFIKFDSLVKIFINPKKNSSSKKKVIILANLGVGDAMDFICIADKYNIIFPKEEYEITVLCNNTSHDLIKNETDFNHYLKINITNALGRNTNIISRIKTIKELRKVYYDILIDQKWPFTDVTPGVYASNIIKANKKYISVLKPALQIPYKYIKKIYTDIYIEESDKISNIEMYNYVALSVANSRGVELDKEIKYKKSKDTKLSIDLPKDYYIIFASSSSNKKNWWTDNYAELIKKIYNMIKIPVVFCGTLSDKEIIDQIKNQLDDKMYIDVLGKTKLSEFTQIIKEAKFVISNDTGAYHIAVINEVPVAIIAGGYGFNAFIAYDFKNNNYKKPYIITDYRKCFNCYEDCKEDDKDKFPCLETITVEQAWSTVKKMIEENYKKEGEKNERKN